MTFEENQDWLELARDWKDGKLTPVHPEVGRRLNLELVRNHEDPVPFHRSTSLRALSMAQLVRAEHVRAREANFGSPAPHAGRDPGASERRCA